MRAWTARTVAEIAGGAVLRDAGVRSGPGRGVVDSREAGPGDLFVGVPGATHDGGAFASAALEQRAWGVVAAPALAAESAARAAPGGGAVIAADDPLAAMDALAARRRDEVRADVVAITGSAGKTTTEEILRAMLGGRRRVTATADSFNTRMGVAATLLAVPDDAEVVVVEIGAWKPGDLTARAAVIRPTATVITNIGQAHLEHLAGLEQIAVEEGRPYRRAPAWRRLRAPLRTSRASTATVGG